MNSSEERTWGAVCHASALCSFLGIPFGNILGPLIVWLLKRKESAFVDEQGKEALNFQISLTLYSLGVTFLLFCCMALTMGGMMAVGSTGGSGGPAEAMAGGGIFVAALVITCVSLILALILLVLPIMAAIKANSGEMFHYPATIRLLK